ncbi:MAG TPA: ABC transporter permease [Blastocatellia bacterium]|nr:ABC transporter permease [Blastocatellia bacterium]
MKLSSRKGSRRPDLWLIRLVSLIVPRRFRREWHREWEAELRHRESLLSEWRRLNLLARIDLFRRSPGSFRDALVLQPQRLEDEMFQDLRYGLRMLRTSRGLTSVAVLSLALGIGANTALFSLVDAVMLKRLPVRNPEQLVLFNWLSGQKRMAGRIDGTVNTDAGTGLSTSTSFSYQAFEQFRAHNQTLSDVFAFAPVYQLNVNAGSQAEIAFGQLVSGGYYTGLGVPAIVGRTITDEDDRATADPVAVISHRCWQRRFGLDPGVVGRTVTVNNAAFTIIGVTPPEFFGALQIGDSPDFSIPLAMEPRLRPGGGSNLNEPWCWWLRIMGRLKPGVSIGQVSAGLEGIFQQSAREGWQALPDRAGRAEGPRDTPRLRVESGSRGLTEVREAYSQPLAILMVVVGLVLMIACANVANLLLARSAARQKEIAVRLAMGASRFRLVRQLLTESLLLSVAGGALGVLLAYQGKDLLLVWHPWSSEPLALDLKLDLRVLGFTVAVSLLTGILFGLAPALRATQVDLTPALKDSARNPSGVRSLTSRSLVVAQVAMSLVLLAGAGLFVRTLRNLQSIDLGFNRENLLLFRVDPRLNNYQDEQIANLYERMIERIEATPGVRSATISRHPLLSGSAARDGIFLPGQPSQSGEQNAVYIHRVRANFFETMEMPLLSGRSLSPRDDKRAPRVAVVNQTLARKFFPNDNPVGKRFGFSKAGGSGEIEIVGVVRDAKYTRLRQDNPPTVYIPYLQESLSQMNFEVRTTGDPVALVPAVREAVRQVDGNLPLFDVKTQSEQIEKSLAQEYLFARLTAFFGLVALALASVGLYGVMAYSVARRTREIGIRMALGARKFDVLKLIVSQGMLLVVIGAVIGLAAALALTRVLSSMLFGVGATDPLTFAGVVALLAVVAFVACLVPARRAAKTDPMAALRYE